MQSYKYRNDSIHETEDEEEEQAHYHGLTSASENEDLYQNNANVLLSNVRNRAKEEDEHKRASSSRPSSSKKRKEHQEEKDSAYGSKAAVRPTSSKSYQGRKKVSSPGAPKPAKSLEFLGYAGEEGTEGSRKKNFANRPRSAPRKHVSIVSILPMYDKLSF